MQKFIVIDTETTNDMDFPLCYDIGFAVIDKKGRVYEKYSFVVAEIFFDKELMEVAYFKDKIQQYFDDIKNGKRQVRQIMTIRNILYNICIKYNISIIMAHNARFDYRSLTTTLRYITKSKYRYFFPYSTNIYCTLMMSRKFLSKNFRYNQYCKDNNYLTKTNQPKLTAEIIYRYITNNSDFIEQHTGLEDVLIEKEIFTYLYKRKMLENGELYARKIA
jgi:DNA polymerase III epsilon subunit-like protein